MRNSCALAGALNARASKTKQIERAQLHILRIVHEMHGIPLFFGPAEFLAVGAALAAKSFYFSKKNRG
jgi:hypothetical protein